MPLALRPKTGSEIDHRKAVLSLQWLLVILASYLTPFSYIGAEQFPVTFGIALAFFSHQYRPDVRSSSAVYGRSHPERRCHPGSRFCFPYPVSPENFAQLLYLGFLAIFVLSLLWRDLRLVLVSLFVVSVLYGVFSFLSIHQLSDRCKHRTVSDLGPVLGGRHPLHLSVGAVDAGCQEVPGR
jgi:hypothetical protein